MQEHHGGAGLVDRLTCPSGLNAGQVFAPRRRFDLIKHVKSWPSVAIARTHA